MTSNNYFYRLNGYTRIHDIFSDDEMRNEIENKFGFGIKEFRDIYIDSYFCINTYDIDNATFKKICFLFFKKIYKFITKKFM